MRTPVAKLVALAAVATMTTGCGPRAAQHPTGSPKPSPSSATSPRPIPVPSASAVPVFLLNPDVTPATIRQTICVAGWTDTVRPPSSYTTALKRRQLPPGADLSAYEEDHLIPLELGGAPRDERNLWPEPIGDARKKDKVENQLHAAVCDATMTLDAARLRMYDWPPPVGGAP